MFRPLLLHFAELSIGRIGQDSPLFASDFCQQTVRQDSHFSLFDEVNKRYVGGHTRTIQFLHSFFFNKDLRIAFILFVLIFFEMSLYVFGYFFDYNFWIV